MPHFLRFVTGVIDTNDLPLNVSREMLQKTPVMSKIKNGLIHRILSELKKRADKPDDYKTFWDSFGIVFKEGLYEPIEQRADVADLCRFYTLNESGLISFSDYVAHMKPGQKNIYYITGSDLETLRHHPQLEGFAARGIDVLLLTDPIDEFWVQTYSDYQGKKIVSALHAREDLKEVKPTGDTLEKPLEKELADETLARFKDVLGTQVKDVRLTDRLTKSPIALITAEGQMSLNLERLMKAHGQQTAFSSERIAEINPTHPLIHKLASLIHDKKESDKVADSIHVLFDQALIAEGEPIKDPAAFTRRLSDFMMSGL